MDSDATRAVPTPPVDASGRLRSSNRRTAIVLASIAAVFFVGIIASKWIGGSTVGIGVMSAAVLLFLAVAIGRNLRSKR